MRRPGTPRPDPAAEPAYAGLKARIIARTGHAYYSDKDDLLLERLYRRMRATGAATLEGYDALLGEPTQGEAEWARLEAEITIGETFFFRYGEQFAALRSTILPDLVASRRAEKRLRIWSAGCSTGAEPYSLAVLVREILGDALPEWRVTILGTDISAEAIATARAAEYGRWALRTMPPEERLRYFTHLPPQPGVRREGGFALRPEFREMVRFAQGNLLKAAEPPRSGEEGYDLILCRNVLIYFDAATVSRVVHGLGRRLRPEGWLLLGHAEPNPTFSAFLDPVSLPGTVAYRPGGSQLAEPAPPFLPLSHTRSPPESLMEKVGGEPDALTVFASLSEATEGGAMPPVAGDSGIASLRSQRRRSPGPSRPDFQDEDVEAASAEPHDEVETGTDLAEPLDRVRMLADAGETGAAWRVLREALDVDPTNAGLRFYEGLVAASLGREAEAERALRAALYLDRTFVMAHYHLGLLLLGLGRRIEAVRALDNAFALSQSLPPDAVLPEGDGALACDVAAGVSAALGRSFGTMRGRA